MSNEEKVDVYKVTLMIVDHEEYVQGDLEAFFHKVPGVSIYNFQCVEVDETTTEELASKGWSAWFEGLFDPESQFHRKWRKHV